MENQLPMTDNDALLNQLAEKVAKRIDGEKKGDSTPHPLDTLEVRHLEGTSRYAVVFLGEYVKQVTHAGTRSQEKARSIAEKIKCGVENAVTLMIT